MNRALVITSILVLTGFLNASEGDLVTRRVARKQVESSSEYVSLLRRTEPESPQQTEPSVETETPEFEKKSAASKVLSAKDERDRKHFLKLYGMIMSPFESAARYGSHHSGLDESQFTLAREQLQSAMRRNDAVAKNPVLVTDLVKLCQREKQILVEDPQSKPQPRTLLQEMGIAGTPQSGTYKQKKYFKSLHKDLQLYTSSIASLLVDYDVDLSSLTAEFPPKEHADECLSCEVLRNAMLDQREAQQKADQSS